MKHESPLCLTQNINHICIAVSNINQTLSFYENIFGIGPAEVKSLPDQRIMAALISVGTSHIEFIQPTDSESGVAKFIDKRGEALHHIGFEVTNLQETLSKLQSGGIDLIDETPREGLAGMIAFVHPKATRGVLVELIQSNHGKR